MAEISPLRCVGCGATDFDPAPGAEARDEPVMTLARFWVMAPDGPEVGPAYAVCNACHNRGLGFLWSDDGTLARTWYVDDGTV